MRNLLAICFFIMSSYVFAGTYTPLKKYPQKSFQLISELLNESAHLNKDPMILEAKFSFDDFDDDNLPEKYLKELLFDRYFEQFSSYRYFANAYSAAYFKQVAYYSLGPANLEEQKNLIRKTVFILQSLEEEGHQLLVYEGHIGVYEMVYPFMMIVDVTDQVAFMVAVANLEN